MQQICTLDKYRSWVSTLTPLYNAELHFRPNAIICHSLDSSGTIWVKSVLSAQSAELDICVDIEPLQVINDENVTITYSGNAMIIKCGKIKVEVPKLVDKGPALRNKESIEVKWPCIEIVLPIDDIREIKTLLNKTDKFSITLNNHTLTVRNITNIKYGYVYETKVDVDGTFESKYYGTQLLDVMLAPKHFETCTILLGTECPLMLHYNCEWLDVTYMLAPLQEPK